MGFEVLLTKVNDAIIQGYIFLILTIDRNFYRLLEDLEFLLNVNKGLDRFAFSFMHHQSACKCAIGT